MNYKHPMGCILAGLLLLGLSLTGCSADTQRVVTGPSETYVPQHLATDTEWTGSDATYDEYEYYDLFAQDEEPPSDNVLPHEDEDDEPPSNKPIDNGKL